MKKIILFCILNVLILSSCANQRNVNQFYNKYQGTENSMSFTTPMFLASIFMGNNKEYQAFKDKIKSVRVLTLDDLDENRNRLVQQDIKTALIQDGFQNWFSMNKDGSNIQISAQNQGKSLKNLVISMQGEDNLVFVNAKTNLTEKELTEFITNYVAQEKKEKTDSP